MKIIAKIMEDPIVYAYIEVDDFSTGKKIKESINKGNYAKAMDYALDECVTIKEIREKDLRSLEATLILTRKNAHWDLTAE